MGVRCRNQPEPCLHCYRLAYDLNGGDAGVTTEDGDRLSTKVKNLRRLSHDTLLEDGAARRGDRAPRGDAPRHRLRAPGGLRHRLRPGPGGGRRRPRHHGAPGRRIAAPDLRFWEPPPALRSAEAGTLDIRPQYLAFLEGARAFPRSNVVIAGGKLVYDLAAHPRRPDIMLQDGLNPRPDHDRRLRGHAGLVEVPEAEHTIAAGLMMFGLQSRNYGHWFCEFVPRMLCYNDPRCPDGIPLCIDDHTCRGRTRRSWAFSTRATGP